MKMMFCLVLNALESRAMLWEISRNYLSNWCFVLCLFVFVCFKLRFSGGVSEQICGLFPKLNLNDE